MPDCEEVNINGENGEEIEPEQIDTVSFAIQLHQAKPEGIKLSKRQVCFVNIEATDDAAE